MFKSFLTGGFECASHYQTRNRRLDIIAATAHDAHVFSDYKLIRALDVKTIREGIRWHLIEKSPYRYDFSGIIPLLRAARELGLEIIWDLCHYGYPDGIDIFSPDFVRRLAGLARAFGRLLADESDSTQFIVPINEISFFSWAGAEVGYINPFVYNRGYELKKQLVRAAIEAIEAIKKSTPNVRIVAIDPLINVIHRPDKPEDRLSAESYHEWQYQALDMLTGRMSRELGGDEKYLDTIGISYYPYNQWFYGDADNYESPTIPPGHPAYRPFSSLLGEIYERYRRPVFIAETGAEDEDRVGWLQYIAKETRKALKDGIPVVGLCWYPVLNHPGWDDDRHCFHGLWDYADKFGKRQPYSPLIKEFKRQQRLFNER